MSAIKKYRFVLFSLVCVGLLWISIAAFLPEFSQDNLKEEKVADLPQSPVYQEPVEFALFTMPKTGTHLMRPFLEYLTDRDSISYWSKEIDCPKAYLYDKNMLNLLLLIPNVLQMYWLHQPIPKQCFLSVLDNLQNEDDFLVTHAPFSAELESVLKERGVVVFFLIRDPRDWVVSVIKHPPVSGLDIYGSPLGNEHFLSLDFNRKIDFVIDGTPNFYSALEVFNKFIAWRESPICCTIRFEALLGPKGGTYSEKEQRDELRKIAAALHLDDSDEELLEAFNASFGKGTIFSKGKAGAWKEFFTEEHKAHFKEMLGDVLIDLGYEKDYNW